MNLFYPATYRCLAFAFAHLGCDAEAREAAARLLEVDPAFTISSWIAWGGQLNAVDGGAPESGLNEHAQLVPDEMIEYETQIAATQSRHDGA